jgi:hypothetical protein
MGVVPLSEDPAGRHVFDCEGSARNKVFPPGLTQEIVAADHKWFTRVVVASAIMDALASLNLKYPSVSKAQVRDIARARALLERERGRQRRRSRNHRRS